MSKEIRRQVLKDAEILNDKSTEVTEYFWEFFRSADTKKIGPTQSLKELLEANGIGIIIKQ